MDTRKKRSRTVGAIKRSYVNTGTLPVICTASGDIKTISYPDPAMTETKKRQGIVVVDEYSMSVSDAKEMVFAITRGCAINDASEAETEMIASYNLASKAGSLMMYFKVEHVILMSDIEEGGSCFFSDLNIWLSVYRDASDIARISRDIIKKKKENDLPSIRIDIRLVDKSYSFRTKFIKIGGLAIKINPIRESSSLDGLYVNIETPETNSLGAVKMDENNAAVYRKMSMVFSKEDILTGQANVYDSQEDCISNGKFEDTIEARKRSADVDKINAERHHIAEKNKYRKQESIEKMAEINQKARSAKEANVSMAIKAFMAMVTTIGLITKMSKD